MWQSSWLALDTETTGFSKQARVLEIGLVYFENGEPVQEWSRVLNPPGLDWNDDEVLGALEVNGLSKEYCAGNPTFAEVMVDLLVWLEEKVWVGHNLAFDIRMLKQEFDFAHTAWGFKPLELCTQYLSYKLDTQVGNKLEDVAPRWGVEQPFAHRAVIDAKVSGQILQKMILKGHLPKDHGPMEHMRKEAASAWHRRSKGRR